MIVGTYWTPVTGQRHARWTVDSKGRVAIDVCSLIVSITRADLLAMLAALQEREDQVHGAA